MSRAQSELSQLQGALRARLDDFARQVRARLLFESAARWLAIVVGLLLLTFILDRTLRLSLLTRRGLLLAFLAVAGWQAWRLLIAPMRLKLKPQLLAAALERRTGRPVAARVATVLELPELSQDHPSGAMVRQAVTNSHQALQDVDFTSHFDPRRRKFAACAIATVLLLSLGLTAIFPSTVGLWAARLFAGSERAWPQRTYLDIAGLKDGAMIVPRGEPFILRATARDGTIVPATVTIHWRQQGSNRVTAMLTSFADNDFRYDFPAIQEEAIVEIAGGDDRVGPFTIRPADRPRVVDLRLVTRHPSEPAPRTHSFSGDDSGELAFLPFTRMELSFTANTPIGQAKITSSTTRPSGGDLRRIGEREFAIAWEHSSATGLQIELTSAEADFQSPPTNISIGLRTDKPPRMTLAFSGVRSRVTPQATIPLAAEARDDYGVDRIDLMTRSEFTDPADSTKSQSSATTQPIFGPATQPGAPLEADVRQTHAVNLAPMELQPGHNLTFTAAGSDAAYPTAQTAISRPVSFRVVRPEELFKEILLRQQAERAKFHKQIDEARKLQQALGAKPLAPEAIVQLARQHRSIQREVNRTQAVLIDSLTELRLNVLGNPETHELIETKIVTPLKSMDQELMNPQKDALDTLFPDNADAIAASVRRQEQIITRMEEILRQMAQWDRLIDAINQLNEIIRLENQVNQETNKLKRQQTEGVFDP
jgi:hypothetical protein